MQSGRTGRTKTTARRAAALEESDDEMPPTIFPCHRERAEARRGSGAIKRRHYGWRKNRLEGEARRMIDGGSVTERKLQSVFRRANFTGRRSEERSRNQLSPFRRRQRRDRSWSERYERLTRTVRAGAGTGFARQPLLVFGGDGIVRRVFDVRGIIATGVYRRRRKESDRQICQRHSDGETNQTW